MTAAHILGFAAALAVTLLPGLWAGRRVKTAGTFSGSTRSLEPRDVPHLSLLARGPGTVFACRLLFPALPFDPLFAGVGLSLGVMLFGLLKGVRHP